MVPLSQVLFCSRIGGIDLSAQFSLSGHRSQIQRGKFLYMQGKLKYYHMSLQPNMFTSPEIESCFERKNLKNYVSGTKKYFDSCEDTWICQYIKRFFYMRQERIKPDFEFVPKYCNIKIIQTFQHTVLRDVVNPSSNTSIRIQRILNIYDEAAKEEVYCSNEIRRLKGLNLTNQSNQ